jgi:hypothetical protein
MSRPTLTPARWVNIDDIRPSTYNPRQADPARLDLVELSLRKLGFVLPLFADADGELLSGHQRHHVATRMGATRVPVAFTKAMDLNKRKAVNILFNRATNDFATTDSSKSITQRLMGLDLPNLAAKVPDKSLTSDDFGRTLNPHWVPIKPLIAAIAGLLVNELRERQRLAVLAQLRKRLGLQRVAWMHSHNKALQGVPAKLVENPEGLEATLAYLDGTRGPRFEWED